MSVTIDIQLRKANKNYYEGDIISGVVMINCMNGEVKHEGLFLEVEGCVNLQLSTKNQGIFEAFYNSVNKPLPLINASVELLPSNGKLAPGSTEIPFEFELTTKHPKVLYETYHGVFVSITYMLKCELKRTFLAKDVQKTQQFIIQYRPTKKDKPVPVNFSISPESLQKLSKERIAIPRMLITGCLDSTDCCLTKPFTGSITVHHSEIPVKSIEIQLVRVETCGCAEGYSRDATEIQNIQIADGNICPKLAIPIYMIFPRLFTCPTLITKNFKIEYELNIVLIFKDEFLITENFQIVLNRNN